MRLDNFRTFLLIGFILSSTFVFSQSDKQKKLEAQRQEILREIDKFKAVRAVEIVNGQSAAHAGRQSGRHARSRQHDAKMVPRISHRRHDAVLQEEFQIRLLVREAVLPPIRLVVEEGDERALHGGGVGHGWAHRARNAVVASVSPLFRKLK